MSKQDLTLARAIEQGEDFLVAKMDAQSKKTGVWSADMPSWISAVSQLAATLILLVGYFYTVKPAYDRERLQQEVKRLTEEGRARQEEAAEATERVGEAERRIAATRETQTRLTQDIQRLSEEKAELEVTLDALRDTNSALAREAEAYSAQARTALETARDAQESVFHNGLTLFLSQSTFNRSTVAESLNSRHGSPDALREVWEDYSAGLAGELDTYLSGDSSLPVHPTLLEEFRRTARERFKSLGDRARCPAPDFSAWSTSISQAYSAYPQLKKEAVELCGKNRFSHWIRLNEWSDAEVKRLERLPWWQELAVEQSVCPFDAGIDGISFELDRRWRAVQFQCSQHMAAVRRYLVQGGDEFQGAPREALESPPVDALIEMGQRFLPSLGEGQ